MLIAFTYIFLKRYSCIKCSTKDEPETQGWNNSEKDQFYECRNPMQSSVACHFLFIINTYYPNSLGVWERIGEMVSYYKLWRYMSPLPVYESKEEEPQTLRISWLTNKIEALVWDTENF